ncbi:hypothetical protein [Nonomuraea recticatena]|uniref:Uncharacterized protein n=1 Tax=Nonomuraea recticatena TaxID=46178 RepID=A0ABP6FUW0_9ACTN
MNLRKTLGVGALAAGGMALAVRYGRARRRHAAQRAVRWFAVTVQAEPDELRGASRPQALAELARHGLRITPAPGGRGSEVTVRATDEQTREQLRAVKQLLETGEVLRMDGQPEGHRTALGRIMLPAARRLMRAGAR